MTATVVECQRVFEQALHQQDVDFLLVALLRLIDAVEQACRRQLGQLQAIEPVDNPDLYHDTVRLLLRIDLLACVSDVENQEASDLRNLLNLGMLSAIIAWYEVQWSLDAAMATNIIISIASALRRCMTFIYGNTDLLRMYTKPDKTQEAAYQQIVADVDILRACRNQLRHHFNANDVDIPLF
jgi:hypothetical protein